MAKKKSGLAASGRRIGSALLFSGVTLCVLATGAHVALFCITGNACAAAVAGSYDLNNVQAEFDMALSTPQLGASLGGYSLLDFGQAAQQTGIFVIIAALLVLLSMEAVELKYLRLLTKRKNKLA